MSLSDASSDEFSPTGNKSSEETIKMNANAEDSVKVDQMKYGSEIQDRYQGFLQWLRTTDDCPEIRVLNGFILYHAKICDIPFLDENYIDEFIEDFDFAGSERGGKSVIQTLVERCENKLKRLNVDVPQVAGEQPYDRIISRERMRSEIKALVELCENKLKTICVESKEKDSEGREVAGEDPTDQSTEEDAVSSLMDRVMESWLDIWIKNFNPDMEYIADYVSSSLELVERSKRLKSDKEWKEARAIELDVFLEKLRAMKRQAKSVRERLCSSSSSVEDPALVEKQ